MSIHAISVLDFFDIISHNKGVSKEQGSNHVSACIPPLGTYTCIFFIWGCNSMLKMHKKYEWQV